MAKQIKQKNSRAVKFILMWHYCHIFWKKKKKNLKKKTSLTPTKTKPHYDIHVTQPHLSLWPLHFCSSDLTQCLISTVNLFLVLNQMLNCTSIFKQTPGPLFFYIFFERGKVKSEKVKQDRENSPVRYMCWSLHHKALQCLYRLFRWHEGWYHHDCL